MNAKILKVKKKLAKADKKPPKLVVAEQTKETKPEKKREAKANRKVNIDEDSNIIIGQTRKWNDFKGRNLLKGSFSRPEVESLKKSLLSYISEHSLSKDEFIALCSESAKDQASSKQVKNAWCQVAEAL